MTEADHQRWQEAALIPYLDAAAEAFGPARLMIGSDWPVCLLAAGYERTMAAVMSWAGKFSRAEQAGLFGENCARFYRRGNLPA